MASTFTTNLGVEKPAKGDYANNWQAPANNNYDLLDRAISGSTTIVLASAGTSGSPNTLPVTDGTLSNGQFAYIEFTDGADLGADAFVQLTPNDAQRLILIKNGLSAFRSLFVFQGTYSAANDLEISNGDTVLVKFDGAGASATAVAVGGSELFNTVTIRYDVTNPTLALVASDASVHSVSANTTDGIRLNAAAGAYGVAIYTGGSRSFDVDQSGNAELVDGVMSVTTETGSDVNILTLNNNNTSPASGSPQSRIAFQIGGVEVGSVGYTQSATAGTTLIDNSGSGISARLDGSVALFGSGGSAAVPDLLISTAGVATAAKDIVVNGVTVGRGDGSELTNTAVGLGALSNAGVGVAINSTAIGFGAMLAATSGTDNVAVGTQTYSTAVSGDENVFVGASCGQLVDSGSGNIAVGYNALRGSTISPCSASSNVAIGRSAMLVATTALGNVAVGNGAAPNITAGRNNICVGASSGGLASPFNVTTENDRIVMGDNSHTNAYIRVAWTVTSDARDKDAIAPIPHGLDFINQLNPVEYQFKLGGRDGAADGIRRYGFLAQEVLAVEGADPVIIDNENLNSLKFREQHLVAVLVKAVQELSAKVDALSV